MAHHIAIFNSDVRCLTPFRKHALLLVVYSSSCLIDQLSNNSISNSFGMSLYPLTEASISTILRACGCGKLRQGSAIAFAFILWAARV